MINVHIFYLIKVLWCKTYILVQVTIAYQRSGWDSSNKAPTSSKSIHGLVSRIQNLHVDVHFNLQKHPGFMRDGGYAQYTIASLKSVESIYNVKVHFLMYGIICLIALNKNGYTWH